MTAREPAVAAGEPATSAGELDPLIHVPTRLKIVATLAALPDGDTLSFTRLQDLIGLTPGNLIIHLRKLEDAGYLSSEKTKTGTAPKTTVALTSQGREALGAYTRALRDLLGGSRVRPASASCARQPGEWPALR
jgi:DNA-binding transcriptional ArsR family regulator